MTSRLAHGTAPTNSMTRFEQFKYEFGLAVGITVISAVLLYLVGRRKLADCFKK